MLVLLPPVGLNAAAWELCDLPYENVVRHEFPGFGARSRADAPPTMASLADEVVASYSGDLDLVGVSMGGMVAQHAAIRHPGRVRSLLVACTGASVDSDVMARRAQAARVDGMRALLDETLRRWFTAEALSAVPAPAGVVYARDTLLRLDPEAFADGWQAIATHDARPGLPSVVAATTVLAGRDDAAAPPSRCREIADLVPGSEFVELDGPHMLHLEHPEAFSRALAEHLARATPARPLER